MKKYSFVLSVLGISIFIAGCNITINNTLKPSETVSQTLPASESTLIPLTKSPTTRPMSTQKSERIVRIFHDSVGLLLLNERNKIVNSFPFEADYFSIHPDSCEIIGDYFSRDSGFQIRIKDYHGRDIQTINPLLDELPMGFYRDSISPDIKWLTYTIVGEYGYGPADSEYQQLFIVAIDEKIPQKPIQLTKNAGAYPGIPTWSPDGKYLAYTDFNQQGVPQLFIYDLEQGKSIRITNFQMSKATQYITLYQWSPDSSQIALVLMDIEKSNGDRKYSQGKLGLITINNQKLQWLNLGEPPIKITELWWGANNNLIVLTANPSSTDYDQIKWIDVGAGKIYTSLKASDFPNNRSLDSLIPLKPNLDEVTLITDKGIHSYSLIDNTLDPLEDFVTEGLPYLVISPSGFPIPDECYFP